MEWQKNLAKSLSFFNMKVVATINHNIDKDTAEYIVKEFGHKPILEDKSSIQKDTVREELRKKSNLGLQ